mgnify:CR=1 FL=1
MENADIIGKLNDLASRIDAKEGINNKYIDDYTKEIKNVFQAIANGIDGISLPIHMIREMREYLPSNLVISAPVDYPCGLSSSKVRYHMALNSIKSGANTLDYVPNHYFLKHKFSELKKEIKTLLLYQK